MNRRVDGERAAKYSRTVVGVPAETGKSHCISLPPVGSLRSCVQMPSGVVAGTLTRLAAVRAAWFATVLPVLWFGLGAAVVSAAQSGPPSVAATSAPPALTRCRTLVVVGDAT